MSSGGDAEHLGAVRLADVADVGVPVHRGLGQAGGAGGVEPQRPRVVAGRRRRSRSPGAARRRGELVPGVHRPTAVRQDERRRRRRRGPRARRRAPARPRRLTASANSGVASTTRAPESAMILPSSAPVNIVETGTATSPARNAPRMPVSIGISSDITSITRSSRRRPEGAQRRRRPSPTRSSSSA